MVGRAKAGRHQDRRAGDREAALCCAGGARTARGCMACLARLAVAAWLVAGVVALLRALVVFVRGCRRPATAPGRPAQVHAVPEWAARQPDPLIYSQSWLLSQGLAVTWQNPDIGVELVATGASVNAWALQPDTDYRVRARVWNGSTDAPVADLPVHVSYLDFGIGGTAVAIASTTVDLPVKGAAGSPAVASVPWRTPATPGHYCLQVLLDWPFDANPGNNLGQHNVDVQPLNSPRATFHVPVRNDRRRTLTVRLETDAYTLPAPEPCPPHDHDPEATRPRAAARHDRGRHPLPEGWSVDLGDAADGLRLEPGEHAEVSVVVTAPDGFSGRKAVNVHGLAGEALLGGVTLFAEGEADV